MWHQQWWLIALLYILPFNSGALLTKQTTSAATPKLANVIDLLDAPIPSDECVPDVDDEIKKRLTALKEPKTNNLDAAPLSDDAITKRLANLKDMPQKNYDDKAWLTAIDKRTDQEQANDLMSRYMEEASLDNAVQDSADDALKDIERRLKALKGDAGTSVAAKPLDDNSNEHEDEDTVAKKLVTKVIRGLDRFFIREI